MYVTKIPPLSPEMSPEPCDNFALGEHPIVVVEGFAGANEVFLEISNDGKVVWQRDLPLQTGRLDRTSLESSPVYPGPQGAPYIQETWKQTFNAGLQIDLGVVPAGIYDLVLKTNRAVAAVAHFKVMMPAQLVNEMQQIQAGRSQLEVAQAAIQQQGLEIQQEKPKVDLSNTAEVSAFNDKVQHYNQLVENTRVQQAQFNRLVQDYNLSLASYGVKLR